MTQETTQKFINRANLDVCASRCTITEALLNEPCNKYFMDLVSLFSYWAVRNKSIMSSLLSNFIVSIEPCFFLCYNFLNYFTLFMSFCESCDKDVVSASLAHDRISSKTYSIFLPNFKKTYRRGSLNLQGCRAFLQRDCLAGIFNNFVSMYCPSHWGPGNVQHPARLTLVR